MRRTGESSWTPRTALMLALARSAEVYQIGIGMDKLVDERADAGAGHAARLRGARSGIVRARTSPGASVTAVKAPAGHGFGRDREGIPQALRVHHRQRPGQR